MRIKNQVKLKSVIVLFSLGCLTLSLFEFSSLKKNNSKKTINSSAAATCNCYSPGGTGSLSVTFSNQVPGDLQSFNTQPLADCFAWQEFIALNWPVNSRDSFGTPYNYNKVQWETFMPRDVLFQPEGAPPPVWGTMVSKAYAAKFKSQKIVFNSNSKLLSITSKIEGDDAINDLSPDQAAPGGPNWLGAQNGTNLWYEVLLNKDYYDFIVRTGYYNAKTQHDSAKANIPLNFPQGIYNGNVGAIELKIAWMEADNPTAAKWARYKLSTATVMDPLTRALRTTTVALVGMHILHKTQNQPTWVWATFEHIDNVPGTSTVAPPYGYNFYNQNCATKTFTVKALSGRGDTNIVIPCNPSNTPPPYYLRQGGPTALQCSRVNQIDALNAAPINTLMQSAIQSNFPNSVWQYYQLVDVIWSQAYQPDPTVPVQKPRNINVSSMQSGKKIVANTTMETYVQNTNTCFSCHKFGSIANYPPDRGNDNLFGDFSFAIGFAKYPKSSLKKDTKK